MSKFSAPHFVDEDAARYYLEAIHWPLVRVCPHCGSVGKSCVTRRVGKYRCGKKECRKDFTVKVGTVFEASHIALHKWLLAAHLLCSSKKGMSSHQLHRYLAEYDFPYNNRIALGVDDTARVDRVLAKIEGKRFTYRR